MRRRPSSGSGLTPIDNLQGAAVVGLDDLILSYLMPVPNLMPVALVSFNAWLDSSASATPSAELPSRLVAHRHRARAILEPVHEPQVERSVQPGEQLRSIAGDPRVHYELVLVD